MSLRLALTLATLALAYADTTGTSVLGYTFGSDIQGYLDISQDVCDITTAVDAGDFGTAAAIYAAGKNSRRGDGTLRALKAWTAGGEVDEEKWGAFAEHFDNATEWLDAFITAGLDGAAPWTAVDARKQVVKKGIHSNLLTSYMWHELDEAAEGVQEGETDLATGAPHTVDEAAAIFFGTTCPAGSLVDVATKRAKAWGTMVAGADGKCVAPTTLAAAAALKGMHDAAKAGDSAAFDTAYDALDKAIVTVFAQATLTYAAKLEDILETAEAGAVPDTAGVAAEAIAFYRTIAPLVATVSPADAAEIAAVLATPAKGVEAEVETHMKATLEAYGITPAELGTLGATNACVDAA